MKTKSLSDYEIIEKIGQGGQGSVYKVINRIALKTIKAYEGSNKYNSAKEEIENLEKIVTHGCHPNVICYYSHFYDPKAESILIEMELVEGQNLTDYAKVLRNEGDNNKLHRHILLILKDLIHPGKATIMQ